jgi:hypothetical protein
MYKFLKSVSILSLLLIIAIPAQAVTVDLVPVGNPGNATDPTSALSVML